MKRLRTLGYQVQRADDSLQCLSYIKSTKVWTENNMVGIDLSIILLDWKMPNCDGLTCAGRIRVLQKSNKINDHTPIIGVTANVRTQQINQALAAGMDDVVSKPFSIADLETKIANLLQKNLKDG